MGCCPEFALKYKDYFFERFHLVKLFVFTKSCYKEEKKNKIEKHCDENAKSECEIGDLK